MIIREKRYEDIPMFVQLVTDVWNETYRGIVDNEFLDNMTNNIEKRIKRQQENFNNDDFFSYVLEDNGKLIGYTAISKSNDEEYPNSGEICTLYLKKEYKGKGLGRKLFEHSENKIKELGYNDFIIGCLDKNPSNEFYKHMGGKLYKQKYKKIDNKEYKENYYHFEMR